ncbi:hypothetical protein [Rhizobium rhizogenes]|uniref:hypothetical protein n=1 Tax=Rhizobium rhizogenes TaxID=359 RepID=UPI0022C7DB64|nr:hypothetical protein [Rhizobium rhizogenes]MCZ7484192.1 hypothetical protein [Rhizobium rhizogenes]
MGIPAKFLLLISALLVLGSSPVQAASLSPEETAELYYRAWLNFDRSSMARLDKEWGSANGGPRYVDMELVADPVAWQLKYKSSNAPNGTTSEQQTQVAKLWVASTKRARCQAEPARIGAQLPTGVFLARIKMNCVVPDAEPAFKKLKAGAKPDDLGDGGRMPSADLMKQMAEAAMTAPVTHKVTTEIQLVSGADKRVWRVGSGDVQPETGIDQVSAVFIAQMLQSGLLR